MIENTVDANNNGTVAYYNVDALTATDYYPFGMAMPGRQFNSDEYRYGFNGKEKDKDIHSLNAYDYGFRIYNPGLGRFLSVDPLQIKFANLSPYNYCYNSPIHVFDPDGKLGIEVHVKYNSETGKYTVLSIEFSDDLYKKAGWKGLSSEWYDYIKIVTDPEDPSRDYPSTEYEFGEKRYETTFLMQDAKWFAKWKVDDGIFDEYDYGGIAWYSEEGGGGEETKHSSSPDGYENIDGILALVKGGNELGEHSFEKKDLVEVIKKFGELVIETSDKKPGDNIDKNDPKQKKILGELDALLAKYSDAPDASEKIVKPAPVVDHRLAPPAGVVRDPNSGVATQWMDSTIQTIPSYDRKKPDTTRTTHYRKPTNTLGQH